MVLHKDGILKRFSLVVYPIDIVVAIGDVEEEVNNHFAPNDEDANWIEGPKPPSAAKTYNIHGNEDGMECIMIWLPDKESCTGSYFCHEVGHAALEVFKYIEALVDYENQEPFCYLLQTIFRFVNGAFYEWKEFLEKENN